MNQNNRLPRPSPVWPPLLLLLAGVLMVGVALIAAERQNDQERERSRVRVAAALQTLFKASGATARDYGVWDEGVANLVTSLDADWADKNIGAWLYRYGGVSHTLVVAPDNGIPYAYVGGTHATAKLPVGGGLAGLVERARAAARDEEPDVFGLATYDGRLMLAAVVAIRAEDTSQVTDPVTVLVLLQDFAGYILPKLAETVDLPNLTVEPFGPTSYAVTLPLREGGGGPLAQLAWSPPRPGSEFLQLSLPASLAAFAIIAALATALWRGLRGAFGRLHTAYEEIAATERRQQVFLGASPDTWLRLDARGVVLDFIGPREGLTEQPIRPGDHIDQVLPGDLAERLRQAIRIALFCGTLERFDFALGVPPRWFEARVVRLDQGEVVLTASDVTARKTAEELLVRQAHYDALTGLPNRALAIDRLAQAMSRADRGGSVVGVAIFDLAHFRAVNDTWGHSAGDALLVEVAARLSGVIRKSDTLGRLEGDEFLLVLPDIENEAAVDRVVEKALQSLRRPATIAGHEVFLSALAGVCSYPTDGATTADLLRNADTALYNAKRDGHAGARRFHNTMTDSLRARTLIETRLQRALSAGELSLHYQPLFDLRRHRIAGAEALLRWTPADMEPVGPAQFIPVAEATGLIVDIGRWVLDEACRTAVGWRSLVGDDFRIAVNLSPRQFRQDIVADVAAALRLSGLPPEALELEITEGLLVNEEQARALFTLHEMGVRLSIDDFGTGFSSLGYLRRFPFHTLKVDRSFVSNVTSSAGDATLTLTIVTMARSLGLSTIGEGVETQEQLAFLHDCGCDEIQGYLISPPVPPRQFGELLEAGISTPLAGLTSPP